VSFKHCPREANEAANELVRSSFSNKLSSSWLDEPPGFILSRIVNDVTILRVKEQILDALFFLPGYLRGLEDFN
jgi:hypothetical protein